MPLPAAVIAGLEALAQRLEGSGAGAELGAEMRLLVGGLGGGDGLRDGGFELLARLGDAIEEAGRERILRREQLAGQRRAVMPARLRR